MYKIPKYEKSRIKGIKKLDGETIETKIERIMENKEPIKDGAPEIFTPRKDGVVAAYNIRTDRWEVAAEAMDSIGRERTAKREEAAKKRDSDSEKAKKAELEEKVKVIEINKVEPTQGTGEK